MKKQLTLAAVLTLVSSAAFAQSYNQPAYCKAMGEQADANKVITIPIPEDTLRDIYKRGEAATNKSMFKVLLTGKGDLEPYNKFLAEACDGLQLAK